MAPSRISASGTSESGLTTGPGTAKTSRPRSSAWSTLIIDPLPAAPSTTTSARPGRGHQPVARREPEGLGHHSGRVLADHRAGDRDAIDQLGAAFGYGTSCPDPSTAMLVPPAASAPRCDAASIPRAAPLTTQAPTPPSPAPMLIATSLPEGEQFRAPTTATRSDSSVSRPPPTNSATGGSYGSSRNSGRYSSSPRVTNRAPSALGLPLDVTWIERERQRTVGLAAGLPGPDRREAACGVPSLHASSCS